MATQDQIRQVAEDAVDSANNYITLMEGSPNEKTFLLESPGNPTANDLKKIKKAYGIPLDADLLATQTALRDIEQTGATSLLSEIPFEPGTQEYAAEMMGRVSEVNNRVKLTEDPIKYYTNNKFNKPAAEMIGGIVGTAGVQGLKMAATRNPFGVLTPGQFFMAETLGSSAGAIAYDFGNDILRHLNNLPADDLATNVNQALYDTMLNAMFTGGAQTLAPIFNHTKGYVQKKIFGVNPSKENLQRLTEITETYGLPMGYIQATDYGFLKGTSKVIGVFPWIGSAFPKSQQATTEASRQYMNTIMNGFAPSATVSNLGKDLTKFMGGNYDSVRAAQRYLYENFEDYAAQLGDAKVINIDNFKKGAKDLSNAFKRGTPEMDNYTEFKYPGDGSRRSFGELYNTLSNLKADVTFDQALNLKKMFNDFAINYRRETGGGSIPEELAKPINDLAQLLERDMSNLKNIDNATDEVIFNTALKKLATANDFFAATIGDFSGGVATNVKMVKGNIFSPGAADQYGMMYNKEAFDVILGRAKNDPEAMKHLLDLVQTPPDAVRAYKKAGNKEGVVVDLEVLARNEDGKLVKKVMPVKSMAPGAGNRMVVRTIFDQAAESAFTNLPVGRTVQDFLNAPGANPSEVLKKGLTKASPNLKEFSGVEFNVGKFADALGLNSENGIQVLETALKGTGSTVPQIQKFLQAAESAGAFTITDPSTFLQRRLTLTGFKGMFMFGGMAGGASAATGFMPGIAGSLMTVAALKYGSTILTNPKYLKAFTETFDALANPQKVTKDGLLLKTSTRNDLLEWADSNLLSDDQLQQAEFLQNVDQSIVNLMQNQAGPKEAEKVRERQIEMMLKGPTKEEILIGDELQTRFNPTLMSDANISPGPNTTPLNPSARADLAFGSIDDALASQSGIGGL